MKTLNVIPECMKYNIKVFYDKLCTVLTDWETGEISDYELYDFMVNLAEKIENLSYGDES